MASVRRARVYNVFAFLLCIHIQSLQSNETGRTVSSEIASNRRNGSNVGQFWHGRRTARFTPFKCFNSFAH